MTNPISAVVDYLISLFGPDPEPQDVRAFVNNPLQATQAATGQAVTAAQLQTAYTAVAPVSAAYGGGDPIEGMQRAVANHNGLAFTRQTEAEVLSNNDTLSHNDTRFMSPETNNVVGHDGQQGVGNLDFEFGDITFGDKTTNTATDGGVVNTGTAGDIDATNVDGDGNVVGDDNENVNTGDIEDSNVNIGEDNAIDDSGDQTAGGDIISGNEGPVINDVDMSGGNGGGASGGDGGGGLIGVGNDGGNATGGAGGSGGGIVINDNDDNSVDNSVDNSGQDNSVDNSVDNSGQDNSVDNSQTVDTDVNVSNDVGIF